MIHVIMFKSITVCAEYEFMNCSLNISDEANLLLLPEARSGPGGAGEVPRARGRDRAGGAELAQDRARAEEGSGRDAQGQDHRAAGPHREARRLHVS